MNEDIKTVLSVIDAVMPAIERELKRQWDKGNYINGPAFAAALDRLRARDGAEGGDSLSGSGA